MQDMQVWSLGQEDPLEKEMATHSSILAWKIPLTEEPGELQSLRSQRVRCDLAFTRVSLRKASLSLWFFQIPEQRNKLKHMNIAKRNKGHSRPWYWPHLARASISESGMGSVEGKVLGNEGLELGLGLTDCGKSFRLSCKYIWKIESK